jgi:hypothetical protein
MIFPAQKVLDGPACPELKASDLPDYFAGKHVLL